MKRNILIILLIILFVVSIVPKTFQNDTFYTVTIGEDILRYGFDGIDHYSWHDNLSYTSPHWLFDVINYTIFNSYGFEGLYVGVCILAVATILILYWILKKNNVNKVTAFARLSYCELSYKR